MDQEQRQMIEKCLVSDRIKIAINHSVYLLYTFKVIKKSDSFSLYFYLAIYIHNEKSISANIFCSQILCSTEIVNFLSENCISWAFDVTEYENKHRIYNQVSWII